MTDHRSKAIEYRQKHPSTPGAKKRVEDLGWIHPRYASRSHHSKEPRIDKDGIRERGVDVFDIATTVRDGELMPSRHTYENKKHKGINPRAHPIWKSNLGIAAGNSNKMCPIVRLKWRTSTVVLSACFPREMDTDKFKPHVVTAYHGHGVTYPRWSKESGELRRQSTGKFKLESTSNFPSLGSSVSSVSSRTRNLDHAHATSRRATVQNMTRQFANMQIKMTTVPRGGGRGGGRGAGRGGGRGAGRGAGRGGGRGDPR